MSVSIRTALLTLILVGALGTSMNRVDATTSRFASGAFDCPDEWESVLCANEYVDGPGTPSRVYSPDSQTSFGFSCFGTPPTLCYLTHIRDGEYVSFQGGWTTQNKLIMQGDGNLVVYDSSWNPLWHSGTHGNYGAWVAVQNDGNVVIYNAAGTEALWSIY